MEVRLIGITQPQPDAILDYLDTIAPDRETLDAMCITIGIPDIEDAETWGGVTPDMLIEFAGRLCYRSFAPGLNANVTKIREGRDVYIKNIIESGHGSVLEHVQLNFIFSGVSRILTHELVRHRVGVGISQESMRYVRLTDDLDVRNPWHTIMWLTPDQRAELLLHHDDALNDARFRMNNMARILDLDNLPMNKKKEATSAMRTYVPDGVLTSIMWSANLRTLRHVIEQRTSVHAETEIRIVFNKVMEICLEQVPTAFADFKANYSPIGSSDVIAEWIPGLKSKV